MLTTDETCTIRSVNQQVIFRCSNLIHKIRIKEMPAAIKYSFKVGVTGDFCLFSEVYILSFYDYFFNNHVMISLKFSGWFGFGLLCIEGCFLYRFLPHYWN